MSAPHDTISMLETMPGGAPSLSAQAFSQVLAAQGVHPETLVLDQKGTIAGTSEGALPVVLPPTLPRVVLGETPTAEGDLAVKGSLGAGGMGEVLLAEQRALGREVAVKRLRSASSSTATGPAPSASARATADLLREALVTGGLEHPSIVPVHLLAVAQDGAPCFVMKRIEGTPWSQLLRDSVALAALARESTDPLVLHLEILLQVCDAVAFAHSKGVLHRDLKPANVMVGGFGEVYVLDWGIAVGLREGGALPLARDVTEIVGTPAYMAPEMAAGQGFRFSERTDVYLLGAVLHEVLTGSPPHQGETVMQILMHAWRWTGDPYDAHVPSELGAICRRATALKPEDRYASVRELRAAVVDFLRHREALALGGEAEARAATVEALLRRFHAGEEIDALELHSAFSEARFGFAQALRIWPEHPTAGARADALIVEMLAREIARSEPSAARLLLSQLGAPHPELEAQVEALERRQAERQVRVAALERLEHETDLEVAGSRRGLYALLVALGWSAVAFGVGFCVRTGKLDFGFREALETIGLFAVMNLSFVRRWKQRDRLNQAQRRLLSANLVAIASFATLWSGTWALGLRFDDALVLFMFLVSVEWWVAAVLFDPRAGWVGGAFAAGAVGTALLPAGKFEIFGMATLLGFGLLGRAWRRGTAGRGG